MIALSNPSATQVLNLLQGYGAGSNQVLDLFRNIAQREERTLICAAELAARLPEARYIEEYQTAQASHAIAIRNLDTLRSART